ncbi:MAG: putative bifunctional diguanylate cyclase/phosphodiesterase, partial [Ilumatobacteraceae bacterium]
LWAGTVSLALVVDTVALTFIGFFALAMIYVGLTQRRTVAVAMAFVATPCWLACQETIEPWTWVRLGISFSVWIIMATALSSRVRHDRTEATSLIVRASTDSLTGLATRTALTDEIDRVIANGAGSRSSLVLIDLDGFKGVNDMFGHAAGDELLVELARRMQETLRPDDVIARLGGDEFAALLRGVDVDGATTVARRLLQQLEAPVVLSRGQMAVTASMGITSLHDVADASQAFRESDLAMYDAKQSGKNRYSVFEREMAERREARNQLEGELLRALDADEFELYYQPLLHLQADRVIGVEALLRWNHPQRGLLTPDQFLGASEQIGVIVALGDWILHQACRQAARWQPADPAHALTLSVNVSAPEMLAPGFVDRVRDALDRSGLPANLLVLDVSERLVTSDAPLVRDLITSLRRVGVRIAIDDFGVGHESLADLRDLRVDILKIDRSFVAPLGTDMQATALVRAMIAIADALHLDIVVEGVETQLQHDLLRDLGCQVAQGYFFARPGAAVDVERLLDPTRVKPSRT